MLTAPPWQSSRIRICQPGKTGFGRSAAGLLQGGISIVITVLLLIGHSGFAQRPEFDQGTVFDEVWDLGREHFFDAGAVAESWERARDEFRPRAVQAATHDDFAQVMQELLSTLNTSHTAYFAATDPRRAQMLGIFELLVPASASELYNYDSIGVDCEMVDGKWFARSLYDGMSAAQAGLLYGDEIVSVDGAQFHPIDSFRGKTAVVVEVRRKRDEPVIQFDIPVRKLNGKTMFEEALLASARIIEHHGKRIAYVHMWSYAGIKYQEQLRSLLLFGELRQAEALVLDLRDGWGGASLEYLNLFREPIATLTSRPREGKPMNFSGVWGKPIVLLINRRSTSGKELLTYGFKKLQLGKVVGEPTAGAVVAGRGFLLSNHDVLYLAVSDVEVDGQRLEGQGVGPDIAVPRPLPYAGGADPQLEAALDALSR